jgi:hypothetical protein
MYFISFSFRAQYICLFLNLNCLRFYKNNRIEISEKNSLGISLLVYCPGHINAQDE